MPTRDVTKFAFRTGDVFPHDDKIARYVMRLSIAVGDLRVALRYAVRADQEAFERIYFVRLSATHAFEVAVLFDPPSYKHVPHREEFIKAAVPPNRPEERATLRKLYDAVREQLMTPVDGLTDAQGSPTTLFRELRRIRNGFVHYHHEDESASLLAAAMQASADDVDGYEVRVDPRDDASDMRAHFADAVSNRLLHPFDSADAAAYEEHIRALHVRIVALLSALGHYLNAAEGYFLRNGPPGRVTVEMSDGRRRDASFET